MNTNVPRFSSPAQTAICQPIADQRDGVVIFPSTSPNSKGVARRQCLQEPAQSNGLIEKLFAPTPQPLYYRHDDSAAGIPCAQRRNGPKLCWITKAPQRHQANRRSTVRWENHDHHAHSPSKQASDAMRKPKAAQRFAEDRHHTGWQPHIHRRVFSAMLKKRNSG